MKFKKSHIAILVLLVLLIAAYITRQFIWKKITPEVIFEEQNLISNGDMEILDNGNPVGWNTSVISALLNQQKSTVGSPGFQSDHALIMPVAYLKNPKKWDTQVRDIKQRGLHS